VDSLEDLTRRRVVPAGVEGGGGDAEAVEGGVDEVDAVDGTIRVGAVCAEAVGATDQVVHQLRRT
jgi:hypothetical protein